MIKCTIKDITFDAIQIIISHSANDPRVLTIYANSNNIESYEPLLIACKELTAEDNIIVKENDNEYIYNGLKLKRLSIEAIKPLFNIEGDVPQQLADTIIFFSQAE